MDTTFKMDSDHSNQHFGVKSKEILNRTLWNFRIYVGKIMTMHLLIGEVLVFSTLAE